MSCLGGKTDERTGNRSFAALRPFLDLFVTTRGAPLECSDIGESADCAWHAIDSTAANTSFPAQWRTGRSHGIPDSVLRATPKRGDVDYQHAWTS
jgi:hypothetical protein